MSNWKKKIGKYIFIHYFITFLGEHSNVLNAPLCLCSRFHDRYSWLITFEIFRNFFWDRGVGGWGVSYPNFFGFFLYLQERKHQGETEGREYRREVLESATQVVWPRKEERPRLRRKKDSGDGTTREKKARKTEAEMDGLCQPRHESHRNDESRAPWQNWLEENCVCRSDPTTNCERLEEEEEANVTQYANHDRYSCCMNTKYSLELGLVTIIDFKTLWLLSFGHLDHISIMRLLMVSIYQARACLRVSSQVYQRLELFLLYL